MRVALAWQSGAMRPQARFHTAQLHLVRQSGARLSGVLTDDLGAAVNLSSADASLVFCVRLVGAATLTAQLTCTKLPGLEGLNGYVDTTPPYDAAGRGGRFEVLVPPSAFAAAGEYEGELVYFASASADPAPIYDLTRIYVRDNLYGRSVSP